MIHARQPHTGKNRKEKEYLEGWQRARAELVNFRQTSLRQGEQQALQAQRRMLEPVLAIADNFQAIVAHVPTSLTKDPWVQGVLHVARQLEQALREVGVEVIAAQGQPFDPNRHEAIAEVESTEVPSQHVVEVVQPGYMLGSVVVRPARVKISR